MHRTAFTKYLDLTVSDNNYKCVIMFLNETYQVTREISTLSILLLFSGIYCRPAMPFLTTLIDTVLNSYSLLLSLSDFTLFSALNINNKNRLRVSGHPRGVDCQ